MENSSRREEGQKAIQEAYSSLDEIDQRCKLLWPEWCPPPQSPPRPKNVLDTTDDSQPETPISTGSPMKTPKKTRVELSKSDPKSTEYVLCEVDDLKDEVQDLIKRISETVRSPTNLRVQLNIPQAQDESVEEIQPEVVTEEVVLEEPHPVDIPLSVQITPLPMRTKGQLKGDIVFTQRQIKEVEQENRELVKQILSLRKKYKDARERIGKLKRTITRSETVQKKAFAAKHGIVLQK